VVCPRQFLPILQLLVLHLLRGQDAGAAVNDEDDLGPFLLFPVRGGGHQGQDQDQAEDREQGRRAHGRMSFRNTWTGWRLSYGSLWVISPGRSKPLPPL